MSFDVLSKDLQPRKSRHLEASAGTGKTFALVHLFIRLVLSDPWISFDRLSIITFTKKATGSLKIRLRAGLEESIEALREDKAIYPYLEKAIELKSKPIVLKRLLEALLHFDQVKVQTIHAFAYTLLKQIGWEFDFESSENEKYLKTLIRAQIASIPPTLLKKWKLIPVLKSRFRWQIDRLVDEVEKALKTGLPLYFEKDKEQFHFEKLVSVDPETLYHWVDEEKSYFNYLCEKDGSLKSKVEMALESYGLSYKKGELEDPKTMLELIDFFSLTKLKAAYKDKSSKLANYFLSWKPYIPSIKRCQSNTRAFFDLLNYIKTGLSKILQEDARLGPDAYLRKLDTRLNNPLLLKEAASSLDVLMVDEFQDTDPLQWSIIKKIKTANPSLTLVLVGDPKQAIYAFRRADIYTYMAAKEFMRESGALIDELSTNFRSHPKLIEMLNILFDKDKIPFWFSLPKINEYINCPKVGTGKEFKEDTDFEKIARVQIFEIESTKKSSWAIESARLMKSAYIKLLKQNMRSFACLIQSKTDARLISEAFNELNQPHQIQKPIPFSKLSSSHVLNLILQSFIDPRDSTTMRALWQLPIWEINTQEIDQIMNPSSRATNFWIQVQHLHQTLHYKGLGVFFEEFLRFTLPQHSITIFNFIKMKKQEYLLQWQSLVNFLLLYGKDLKIEEVLKVQQQVLCGQLDEEATYQKPFEGLGIQILTIHASKGLEFDVVFSLGTASESTPSSLTYTSTDRGQSHLFLEDSNGEEMSYLEFCNESDAEKARRLYVAFTRAKNYLFLSRNKTISNKELKRGKATPQTLFESCHQNRSASNFSELYETLRQGCFVEFEQLLKDCEKKGLVGFWKEQEDVNCISLTDNSKKEATCSKTSFFDLTKRLQSEPNYLKLESFTSLMSKYGQKEISESLFYEEEKSDLLGSLPKGKEVGIFWHEVIEKALLLSKSIANPGLIKPLLNRFISFSSEEGWKSEIIRQSCSILNSTFRVGEKEFSLSKLPGHFQTEKSFILSKEHIKVLAQEFEKVPFILTPVHVQGFIDLWVELDECLFFFDWKSNFLGPCKEDYTFERMLKNAHESHYDIQARIYQMATQTFVLSTGACKPCYGLYYYLRGEKALLWDGQKKQFTQELTATPQSPCKKGLDYE